MSARTQVGQTLARRFRVDEILGTGGMGEVVGAFDLERKEAVAIKLMLPKEDEDSSEAQARFLQEARALRRLTSEHVVRIHDEGTLADGTVYLVMERLEGHDLQRRLRKEVIPIAEAVGLILQACEALAEAHALGIVHRDLKPGNLFLARRDDGTIALKLLDFGISKMLPLTSSSDELLMTGVTTGTLGTPQYMAPEQMMSAKDIDERADIWALGVNLYQMISRKHPFQSETLPELCALVLKEEPIPLAAVAPDLPAGLDAVVMRCLEKPPSRRFQTVRELMRALAPFAPEMAREITHLQVMALPDAAPAAARAEPATRVAPRRTGWRWVVGGGLVGLVVTLALPYPSRSVLRDFAPPTIVSSSPAPPPAPPPPAVVPAPAPVAPVAAPAAEPDPPRRRPPRTRESRQARAPEPPPAEPTSEAEVLKEWK